MLNPSEINPLDLPSVALEDRKMLPVEPAIYFAIDSTGEIQYVGRSVNPRQRWASHHRYEQVQGCRIAYMFCDADLLNEVEAALIDWFSPPLNGRSAPPSSFSPHLTAAKPIVPSWSRIEDEKAGGLSAKTLRGVVWKLRECMARRRVAASALADCVGVHRTSITRLRNQDTLPEIGNDRIEQLRSAIEELSRDKYGPCSLSELLEISD